MKAKIIASYGGDIYQTAEDMEEKLNELLEELDRRGCTIHRVEMNHQMIENAFSILTLVVYTCHETGRDQELIRIPRGYSCLSG